MSKLYNLASRKNKKNRPVPHTTAEEAKGAIEQKALQKANGTTAVQKVAGQAKKEKNRRASRNAVEEAKTTAEPKALQKVDATTVIKKAPSEAELLAAGQKFFCESLGVSDPEVAVVLVNQVKQLHAVTSLGDGVGGPSIALGMMFEMKPENLAQTLLAVQMSGVHQAALLYMKRAALVAQSKLNSEGPDANMLMAMRLMRLFNEQLETMAKLKGKTGQQKVIVEHVHVHHGGQAIVGAVSAAGGAAKHQEKNDENRTNRQSQTTGLVEKRESAG